MEIRFVSTLTAEDEVRLAEGLLKVFASLLDPWPIAYTIRIDAGDATVLRHSHVPAEPSGPHPQPVAN
jgi:hypothetical protein